MIFKEEKIGNISNRVFSGGTPDTRKNDYWNGNLMWLSSGETRNKYIYKTEKNITQLGVDNSSTRLAHKGDIVIASAGQGYTRGQTSMLMNDMYINQSLICIECDKSKVNNYYLFYLLSGQYDKLRFVSNENSSRGSLTTKIINEYSVKLPSLENQTKIVSILKALDSKIELNNEINNNLHELVNSIYLEYVSSLDENNSSKIEIKNIAKCVLGGTPSRTKSEYWNGNINWINSGEINKFRIIEASEYITDLGLSKSSTTLLPKETTVLAITGATLGQVSRLEIESCANQSVIGIVPDDSRFNNYIYLTMLNNIDDLALRQTGGAQQHINKNDVETFEVVVPNNIEEFDNKVSKIFEKISINCFQNKTLEQLRDTLLPKLMNGEIDLDSIEI